MKLTKLNMFLLIFTLLALSHMFKSQLEGLRNKRVKKQCKKKKKCNKNKRDLVNNIIAGNMGMGQGMNMMKRGMGNDSKYMLKTEMVPPICPKCPDVTIDEKFHRKKCRPCPPCARCPEPSFSCKKVPNYSFASMNTLPQPMLNDFSSF